MSSATKIEIHPAPGKRVAWRRVVLFVVVVAVAGGGIAAWRSHMNGANAASHTEAAAEGPASEHAADGPVPVETVRLAKGGIMKTSTQIGSVHAYEEADLYAKVSGYLAKLFVNYGDKVKRGQLLAVIDDPEIVADAVKAAADVKQAQAAVVQAQAFIEAAKADRDASSSAVEQAIAEVDRYVSMRTYHEKRYARYKDLVQRQAVAQAVADEEQEGYESATANEAASRKTVLKTRADLIAAAARVKKAEADLEEAKANVAVAEAKRVRADVLVNYTKIVSPYDGVITKRNFFRGAFIRSAVDGGAEPLLSVARTDMVYVVTAVPDRGVPFTDVGDNAEVTLDALGSTVFKGKVSRFADSEDPTSRTMHTEIDLPNPNDQLKPGMYGIAKIILDTAVSKSTLPASCLVGESHGGKADIYVIKDGKAKKTRIEIGADDGIRVEVISGVAPDDDVILSTSAVTEGAPVRSVRDATGAPIKTGEPAGKTAKE
ncbi:MAG: efflux RND transporter periplasmic adaptor subunit [Isosphaeraceae bacterium]|nr:efflux RND transporter periplasmic adaptor subunit [Isosphaeraceae bacterium]